MANPTTPRSRAALTLLSVVLAGALPARAAEPVTERFQRTYELTGVTRVHLQNVNGPVKVSTWESGTFRLEAVKKARGSRAEQRLQETEIRVSKRAETIDVETILPKRGKLFGLFSFGDAAGAEVTYDLQLPPSVTVEVETVNGKIVAEKRTGSLSLNTVNGSVRVEAHDGPVHVNTVNGSVDVAFVGLLRPADLETVNGSIVVACSRQSSIRYQLQTVNGRIRSDFTGLTVEGKWGPKEARGSVNGGQDRLAVETVNGEIRLVSLEERVPPPK